MNQFEIVICYNGKNIPESYKVNWGITEKVFYSNNRFYKYLENMQATGAVVDGLVSVVAVCDHEVDANKQKIMDREKFRLGVKLDSWIKRTSTRNINQENKQ